MEFDFRGFQDRRVRPEDVPWDRVLVIVPLLILAAMALYLGAKSAYRVLEYEEAVVLRFGKYHATAEPGLHFCIPLVDEVLKVSTEQRSLRLPEGKGPERSPDLPEEDTLMLTGDLTAAAVEWTIQWKVTDAAEFLFRFYRPDDELVKHPTEVITTVSRTVMNRLVGDYAIDEVLTEKRGEIGEEARRRIQEILDRYKCGVGIQDLQMQSVSAPKDVRPAFNQLNTSIQRRDQLVNEANKERNKLRPAALAEKDKEIREAEGYAKRRQAEAHGEISALRAKYRAYQKAPEVTRQRLYIEAMQEILAKVESKVIVDAQLQQGVLGLLPLDQAKGEKP